MTKDHTFIIKHNQQMKYLEGKTYRRVPEAAAKSILDAKAGEVIGDE